MDEVKENRGLRYLVSRGGGLCSSDEALEW